MSTELGDVYKWRGGNFYSFPEVFKTCVDPAFFSPRLALSASPPFISSPILQKNSKSQIHKLNTNYILKITQIFD